MNSPAFFGIASVLLALLRPGVVVGQDIDVVELTTEQIQHAYAAGEYTSVELTKAFLERINRYEDYYNAFISMNPEALDIAARLDEEYRSSGPRGPLHGVPVVIKDNMDYTGLVTTAGFWGFSTKMGGVDMIPGDDATAVERLRNAGAIILGKTNLPDFAGDGTRTNSSVAGVTLNPYNVTKAPGGSSGGTATAVNASFAVLGLGTETGGSIQNPSSAQALVGVKPTYGLVPLEGVYPINSSYVDVVGPMAKNVHDAAVTLDIISGPTTDDFATFAAVDHIPENGYVSVLTEAIIEGKRFGLVGSGWRERWLPLDPKTETVYQAAISTLTDLGAVVIEDPFAGSGFIELYGKRPGVPTQGAYDRLIYLQGLGPDAAFHSIEEWEELSGEVFRRRGRGRGGQGERPRVSPARPGATEEGDAFQSWRMEIRDLFRNVMVKHELDALFFPQAGAPNRDLVEDPERPDYSPNNWPELPSNIINDFGFPVVTVPYTYYEDNTPFVLAFIGDVWTESDLLGYAYIFEQAVMARRAPELIDKRSN